MSTWTRSLGRVHPAAIETWTLVHTSASSGTTVLRDILLLNASAAAINIVALRSRPAGGGTTFWLGHWPNLPAGTTHLELRQVLPPGDVVEAYTGATTLDVWLTGYVFDP